MASAVRRIADGNSIPHTIVPRGEASFQMTSHTGGLWWERGTDWTPRSKVMYSPQFRISIGKLPLDNNNGCRPWTPGMGILLWWFVIVVVEGTAAVLRSPPPPPNTNCKFRMGNRGVASDDDRGEDFTTFCLEGWFASVRVVAAATSFWVARSNWTWNTVSTNCWERPSKWRWGKTAFFLGVQPSLRDGGVVVTALLLLLLFVT